MKKFTAIVLLLVSILLFILFIPREREHAVVAECSSNYSKVYLGDKLYKIRLPRTYSVGTVINYKYNFFKILKVDEVSPLTERVMIKNNDYYELEKSGPVKLSKSPFYYYLDKNNKLSICTDSKLIVGQNNSKIYMGKKNALKTLIITPIDFSYMRIGISTNNFDSIYHNQLEITCMEDSKLYNIQEGSSINISKGSKIAIEKAANEIIFSFGSQKKPFKSRTYLKGGDFKIDSLKRGNPSFVPYYSGIIEFTLCKDGILMINEVNIEDYLCKVVPSEMPSSGGIESLKCQAIAARTYAISDMLQNRFANLGFYVDDSTQSQVYNNIETNTLASNSVRETSGLIMTSNNTPIDAKYYSSSGGMATTYEDVWFNSDGTSEDKKYYFNGSYIQGETNIPQSEQDWLDFYKNKPNLAIFKDALTLSKNPVCYNGDLFAAKEYEAFCSDFPDINTVMIGRGLIYNPGLAMGIKTNTKLDKNLLKDFHHRLYEDYQNILFGDKNVLFKMKEVWYYMIESFTNHSKYAKKIKKAQRLTDYDEVITSLFAEQEISEDR
jgi:hypothetical protein